MKNAKSAYLALLLAVLLVAGDAATHAQSAQQSADQPKPDSNSANQTVKKSSDGAATPKKDSSTNSTASASTSNSAATPGAATLATTGSDGVAPKPDATKQNPPAKSGGMVWANTESGVYHKPGTRWYGKTRQGKYMPEADAIKAGYHSAKKE